MEFDKSKVYTAVNADELKVGSKVIVSDTYDGIKGKFSRPESIAILSEVLSSDYRDRFVIEGYSCHFNLCYLISEPEEKKLKWTDLKIGDVIHEKDGTETRMITGIDTRDEVDDDCNISHICASGWWCTDEILKNWEKVE